MRIGSQEPAEEPEEVPLEVQLWLNRGWTIIKTERRGTVITGPKTMQGRTKVLIGLGLVLVCLFYFGAEYPGIGSVLLILASLDYQYATKPPTKFFPAEGERKRTMER